MFSPKPRVSGTTHILPYDQLSPRDFERLCLWLVAREGYQEAEHLGASGGEQGRDIRARRDDQLIIFQCKRVQRFGPPEAIREVDKILKLPASERPQELIFLVTTDVSVTARDAALERSGGAFKIAFWASTEFDEKVKRYPDIRAEFFADFREPEARRDHQTEKLLNRVKTDWIDGFLVKREALHAHYTNGESLIPIRKRWAPERLAQSPELVPAELRTATRTEAEAIPSGTDLLEIFEQAGSLLILGGPGSGKTILLLELTRLLVERAAADPERPVPVVLHLASWANQRQPLAGWIASELHKVQYGILPADTQRWLEENRLGVMLDGLDQIPEDLRDDCVRAINQFVSQYGLIDLAVCCRTEEYQVLADKLDLRRALELEALSPEQVEAYFAAAGERLESLRDSVASDPLLLAAVRNPLVLYTMSAICEDQSAQLPSIGEPEDSQAWRMRLFGEYVTTRLRSSREAHKPFTNEQTTGWLGWLAKNMEKQNLDLFSLDQMQPSWLPGLKWAWGYMVSSRLSVGLLAGLVGSLLVGLGLRHYLPLNLALQVGLVEGLFGGLVAGIVMGVVDMLTAIYHRNRPLHQTPTLQRSVARFSLVTVAVFAGVSLAFAGLDLFSDAHNWTIAGLQLGLLFGLCAALLLAFGIQATRTNLQNDIQAIELLSWRRRAAWRGALIGGLAGILGGGLMGSFFGCHNPLVLPLCQGAGYTNTQIIISLLLITGVFAALIGFIFGGLGGAVLETKKIRPDEGLRVALTNTWRIGGSVGLTFSLTGALVAWLVSRSTDYALTYSLYGLFVGVLAGLYYGGLFSLQHLALGVLLWRSGRFPSPRRVIEFLEYTSQDILLERVGGGYKFFAPHLQEYFANLGQGGISD